MARVGRDGDGDGIRNEAEGRRSRKALGAAIGAGAVGGFAAMRGRAAGKRLAEHALRRGLIAPYQASALPTQQAMSSGIGGAAAGSLLGLGAGYGVGRGSSDRERAAGAALGVAGVAAGMKAAGLVGRHALLWGGMKALNAGAGSDLTRGTSTIGAREILRHARDIPAHLRDVVTNPVSVGKKPTGKQLRRQFARDSLRARERMVVTDRDGRVTREVRGGAFGVGAPEDMDFLERQAALGRIGRIYHNHPVDTVPSTPDIDNIGRYLRGKSPDGREPTNIVYGYGRTGEGKTRVRISRFDHADGVKTSWAGSSRNVTESDWLAARRSGSNYRTRAVEKADMTAAGQALLARRGGIALRKDASGLRVRDGDGDGRVGDGTRGERAADSRQAKIIESVHGRMRGGQRFSTKSPSEAKAALTYIAQKRSGSFIFESKHGPIEIGFGNEGYGILHTLQSRVKDRDGQFPGHTHDPRADQAALQARRKSALQANIRNILNRLPDAIDGAREMFSGSSETKITLVTPYTRDFDQIVVLARPEEGSRIYRLVTTFARPVGRAIKFDSGHIALTASEERLVGHILDEIGEPMRKLFRRSVVMGSAGSKLGHMIADASPPVTAMAGALRAARGRADKIRGASGETPTRRRLLSAVMRAAITKFAT
ncbi:hypothetical protein [Falsiroseomonas sp. CW058]|uniref:hypothetical protein n=1 Tax=Falsiroseomonas sp. CW058 TaxID=3388664 RepID=UPI003D311CCA